MSSPFDGLVYVEFILDAPTGWEKQLERDARKGSKQSMGQHGNPKNEMNTCDALNLATAYDEEGVIIQTATRWMRRLDVSDYPNEAALIEDGYEQMAITMNKPVAAVKDHSSVAVIGDQYQAYAHKKLYAAEYNERV